jgi:hypothetical protein
MWVLSNAEGKCGIYINTINWVNFLVTFLMIGNILMDYWDKTHDADTVN